MLPSTKIINPPNTAPNPTLQQTTAMQTKIASENLKVEQNQMEMPANVIKEKKNNGMNVGLPENMNGEEIKEPINGPQKEENKSVNSKCNTPSSKKVESAKIEKKEEKVPNPVVTKPKPDDGFRLEDLVEEYFVTELLEEPQYSSAQINPNIVEY